MRKSRFTEQQVALALQQAEGGTQVAEICRKMGILEATFYRWKQLCGGLNYDSNRCWIEIGGNISTLAEGAFA